MFPYSQLWQSYIKFVIIGIKEICDELGIKEEELKPRDLESFNEPHIPVDMAKIRYERYETRRKGNIYTISRKT